MSALPWLRSYRSGRSLAHEAAPARTALHCGLRGWREARGLSQEAVADALAVNKSHRATAGKAGARALGLDDLGRLAAIYGVDPVALLLAPGDVQLASDLSAAKAVLASRCPDAARTWLALGRKLPPAVPAGGAAA